jgi:hypothetical protein
MDELPEMVAVDSSNISAIGYDEEESIMYVQFHRKGSDFAERLYMYFNVPEEVYNGLYMADSVGSYFHHYIRHSYNYSRLE